MSESPEGFAKKGTNLEGRVAQLLRLMGFTVSRNEIIEDHEIDVLGEKEGKKIIVECKEYYTQLIPRDLILIFSTKVQDINPDEAWFVTIYDFEPSALELCKRYGIRAINGYDLEELEDQAIIHKGEVELGSIPAEDRYLRLLKRRRTILSREKRRYEEIKKIVEQINSLRIHKIELPPFLFPTTERDLEEKYIWLKDLESMPKISDEGSISETIVNLGGQPSVRGFKISSERKFPIAPFIAIISLILSYVLLYYREPWVFSPAQNIWYIITPLEYFLPSLILSIIVIYFRKRLVYTHIKIINRIFFDAEIGENVLYFPRVSKPFVDAHWDLPSQKMYELDVILVDKTHLGKSNNYIVEKGSGLIRALQIRLDTEISEETGFAKTIIPTQNIDFSITYGRPEIKINALYVLSEKFFQEKKME